MRTIYGLNLDASQDEDDLEDTPYLKYEASYIKKLIVP